MSSGMTMPARRSQGTVVGRLGDGSRTLADIDAGPEELLHMEKFELVGMYR